MKWKWSALLFVSFTFCVALSELALRLMGRPKEITIGWTHDGVEKNELGFRGRYGSLKPNTILLMGDSEVLASAHPLAKMPETRFEESLERFGITHTRVMSVSSSGWGQDQELLALKTILKTHKPSHVVLWMTYRNDFWNNTFPTHLPKNGYPKPTYWLENELLKGPNLEWLALYHRYDWHLVRVFASLRKIPSYPTDDEWSARMGLPYAAADSTDMKIPTIEEDVHLTQGIPLSELKDFAQWEDFETEKTHFHLEFYPPSQRKRYSIALTKALLKEIQTATENSGAKFLVTTPIAKQPLEQTTPNDLRRVRFRDKVYGLSLSEQYRVVGDTLKDFPHYLFHKVGPSSLISSKDRHLNDRAIKDFMDGVAQRIHKDLNFPPNQPVATRAGS